MKATFALLTDNCVYNYMRRVAYAINDEFQVGFYGAQLPAHISLKQPFIIDDIYQVEEYFDYLALSIKPVEINIAGLNCWVSDLMGSISLKVQETVQLRSLHNRINSELAGRFTNTAAFHDGEGYRFHATIALGGSAPKEVYQEFYDRIDKNVSFSFTANELAMFYYDDDSYRLGSFITYKKAYLR